MGDEEELEALRLAALATLRAKSVAQRFPVPMNQRPPPRNVPHFRDFRNMARSNNQLFQRHHNNSNLIAIVPVADTSSASVDKLPVPPPRLVLPQHRYCKTEMVKPADKQESVAVVTKFDRYNKSDSETDSDSESSTPVSEEESDEDDILLMADEDEEKSLDQLISQLEDPIAARTAVVKPMLAHSPSPSHRLSPIQRLRSKSPIRQPTRNKSPIRQPTRNKSPIRHPIRNKSPVRQPMRSLSPARNVSPWTPPRQSDRRPRSRSPRPSNRRYSRSPPRLANRRTPPRTLASSRSPPRLANRRTPPRTLASSRSPPRLANRRTPPRTLASSRSPPRLANRRTPPRPISRSPPRLTNRRTTPRPISRSPPRLTNRRTPPRPISRSPTRLANRRTPPRPISKRLSPRRQSRSPRPAIRKRSKSPLRRHSRSPRPTNRRYSNSPRRRTNSPPRRRLSRSPRRNSPIAPSRKPDRTPSLSLSPSPVRTTEPLRAPTPVKMKPLLDQITTKKKKHKSSKKLMEARKKKFENYEPITIETKVLRVRPSSGNQPIGSEIKSRLGPLVKDEPIEVKSRLGPMPDTVVIGGETKRNEQIASEVKSRLGVVVEEDSLPDEYDETSSNVEPGEICETNDSVVVNHVANETSDLRAELSRRRAQRMNKKSIVPALAGSRLVQSAIMDLVNRNPRNSSDRSRKLAGLEGGGESRLVSEALRRNVKLKRAANQVTLALITLVDQKQVYEKPEPKKEKN